jgi:hypothetical protein
MNSQDLDTETKLRALNLLVNAFKEVAQTDIANATLREDFRECLMLIGTLSVDLLPKACDLISSLKDEVARESRFRGLAGKPVDQV